jgi:hypothetical protein
MLFALIGCSDRSQDMEEQVTQLRKELERTQKELQTTKQALDTAKEQLAQAKINPSAASVKPVPVATAAPARAEKSATASLPPREMLEDSYLAAAKSLRKELDAKLKNFSVETCTLHNVQIPEQVYPVTSAISLALKSKSGQPYQLEFPVKADATGKWIFPSVSEIVERVESAKTTTASAPAAAPQAAPAQAAPAAPAQPSSRGQPAAQNTLGQNNQNTLGQNVTGGGMPPNTLQQGNATIPGANSTVVIQWPTAGGAQSTSAPAAQSAPAANAPQQAQTGAAPAQPAARPQQTPVSAMPSDRDVLIKF